MELGQISLRVVALLLCLNGLFPPHSAHASGSVKDPFRERFHYTSRPTRGHWEKDKQSISMAYRIANEHVEFSSRSVCRNLTEEVMVILNQDGHIMSATKTTRAETTNIITSKIKIWLENETVKIQSIAGKKKKRKSRLIPKGQKFAVDISLLHVLRSFPFGKRKEWQVFMADFSGRFITVHIRDRDVERIDVPAGTFECYPVEVTIKFFIFKSRITYWLTKQSPHFLVKHEGKRGPFTKSYTTVLDSLNISSHERHPQAAGH